MPRWFKILCGLMVLAVPAAWALSPVAQPFSSLAPSQNLPTFDGQRVALGFIVMPAAELCSFPDVPDGADIVLLSADSGQGVPSVTLGSQDDAVTTASIVVEPGASKLYIVALSDKPVIWRVAGAVDRVERLVLGERRLGHDEWSGEGAPAAGAAGLPAEKVSFLPHHRCIPAQSDIPSMDARAEAAIVRRGTGRLPSVIVRTNHVSAIHVPSGTVEADISHSLWRKFLNQPFALVRFFGFASPQPNEYETLGWYASAAAPDGVVPLDADRVVADVHVEPYDTLPGYAGLQQLVRAGLLEDKGWGQYHVKGPMRFPAGLTEPAPLSFLLLKGVPMPAGDPGTSCVISEETHAQLAKHCL